MRKSWVPYLHPPARVRPPAAAPRRNARRLRSGSRRSLSGMTSPASPGARTEAPGDLALELREVATDHRQLERAQDRLLGFTLEQELERQADQLFDGDAPAGQLLVVRRRHGHAVDRVGFALGDGDAEDVRTLGAHGDARDHGHPTTSTYRGAENPATPVLTGATAGDGDDAPPFCSHGTLRATGSKACIVGCCWAVSRGSLGSQTPFGFPSSPNAVPP